MDQKSQESAAKQNVPKPELTLPAQDLAPGPLAQSAAALRRVSSAPAEPLNPGEIIALQRTVGNQVVQRTLAVGSPGRDEVQRDPALITARAGAAVQRTNTGIAKGETVKEFTEGARGVQSEWEKLSTSERANKLGALANAALATVKVPPVTITIGELPAGANGSFSCDTWTLTISQAIISKDSATESELAKLSGTFYHEARHAEQYFRVARWMAGVGRSARAIAAHLVIPARIAQAAKDDPLEPIGILDQLLGDDSERAAEIAEARRWAASLSPVGRQRYSKVISEMEAAEKAFNEALAAYQASQTEENREKAKKARDTYKEKYKAYRRFVEEKDAFKTGGEAEQAFQGAGTQGAASD